MQSRWLLVAITFAAARILLGAGMRLLLVGVGEGILPDGALYIATTAYSWLGLALDVGLLTAVGAVLVLWDTRRRMLRQASIVLYSVVVLVYAVSIVWFLVNLISRY